MNMIDLRVEPSYKTLYEMEKKENEALKRENIRLHKNNDTLTRMLDKLSKQIRSK